MQQENSSLNTALGASGKRQSLGPMLIALCAGLLYLISLASTIWMPALAGIANGAALLVLGAAVCQMTLASVAPNPQQLVSVRSQGVWRRQRWLAYGGVAGVYLALTYGTLASLVGGVWSCTTLPLCTPLGNEAATTMVH